MARGRDRHVAHVYLNRYALHGVPTQRDWAASKNNVAREQRHETAHILENLSSKQVTARTRTNTRAQNLVPEGERPRGA